MGARTGGIGWQEKVSKKKRQTSNRIFVLAFSLADVNGPLDLFYESHLLIRNGT